MTRKTLAISEEAYEALSRLKKKNESFTKVILRLADQKKHGKLSDYLRKLGPDEELANNIERVSKRLRSSRLRPAKL